MGYGNFNPSKCNKNLITRIKTNVHRIEQHALLLASSRFKVSNPMYQYEPEILRFPISIENLSFSPSKIFSLAPNNSAGPRPNRSERSNQNENQKIAALKYV